MAFSLNPITLAKAELLKVDDNHNGKPDAIDALEAAEKACEILTGFAGRFDAADVAAIMAMLPASVKAKLPEAEIEAVSAAIVALPPALKALEARMKALEVKLEAK